MRNNWLVLLALAAAPLLLGSANPSAPAQHVAHKVAKHDDRQNAQRAEAAKAGLIRFDGVYQAAYADYFFYLRLYPDGTAITVTAPESSEALNDWFNRSCVGLPRGPYTIQSGRIQFTAHAKRGAVEYAGTLGPDRIDLHVRSLMNGHESDHSYRFIAIGAPSEQLSDDAPASCRN